MSNTIQKFKKKMKENITVISCHYCGCNFSSNNKTIFPIIDHVVPISKGGKNARNN